MCFYPSILVRVQAAGAGAERDIVAVPQTRAAVYALLAVEQRHAVRTARDRLSRADLDAQLRRAPPAKSRVGKADVIAVSGRRLHFSADQQRVLMRHQQLAVEGNRRPTAVIHQRVMAGDSLDAALRNDPVD